MTNTFIQTHTQESVFFITLNRPEKRNAITLKMLEDIANAVLEAEKDATLRAIIVCGEGPIFSSGIDLNALMQAKMEAGEQNPSRWLRRLAGQLQYFMHIIESTELPVIGAIQGQVMGLGLELALTFDFRVVTDTCKLSIPESRLGLVADVGGTTRLSRIIGPSRAKDMLMTARSIEATEALQWGLVNRVVSEDDLMDSAIALAEQIAKNAPLAVGMAKLIVDQGDGLDKQTQMVLERWAQSQLISTEDVGEAMTAFMQKRPSVFKGR